VEEVIEQAGFELAPYTTTSAITAVRCRWQSPGRQT